MPGAKGSSTDHQRTAGMRPAFTDYPNIKIVTAPPGNWTSEDARKSFDNTLPSVPDFVGVFAQNDSEATGVIAALDAQGIKGKVGHRVRRQQAEHRVHRGGQAVITSATIGGLTAGSSGSRRSTPSTVWSSPCRSVSCPRAPCW